MSNNILFVFEGEKTEDQIIDSLKKFYFNQEMIITCAYCNNIYNLYKQLHTDEDLDTFNLLKDIPINKQNLKEYKRTDFAEIYLFFDYDGHDTMADDSILIDLILKFNEETEKGKLYISYPMIESIKHISDFETFRDLKVKCNWDIVRGLFDSDGNVSKNGFKITSASIKLISYLENFFNTEGFKTSIIKKGNAMDIYIRSNQKPLKDTLKSIRSKLYNNSKYYLKRKKDQLDALCSDT